MRGLIWAQYYFPADFFEGNLVDEDERSLELPSHAAPWAERCLWLGVQLASVSESSFFFPRWLTLPKLNRWIRYDNQIKQCSVTHFARSLESIRTNTLDSRSRTLSIERDLDSEMIDIDS